MTRAILAFTCFLVAALVFPIAISPIINGADLVFWGLGATGVWLLRPRPAEIPPEHPDGATSLDIREREGHFSNQ